MPRSTVTSECVMLPCRHTCWTCAKVTADVRLAWVVARRASMGCQEAPVVSKDRTGSGGGGGAGDRRAHGAGGMAAAGKNTRARTRGKAKLEKLRRGRQLVARCGQCVLW
eukprot:1859308-Amphidinium_carterae.4